MADEIIEENTAVTTGKELLDATQNAVINAVENVSEIIETKEEKKVETALEQIIEPKVPFYTETEFWVAMAFCLLVIGLFIPISKVIKSMLRIKIEGIVKRIDDAVNLRDEAQKLLADYERKLNSAKKEAEIISLNTLTKIEIEKENQLKKMESELKNQKLSIETKIDLAINNVKHEISDLICGIALENVKKICSDNIDSEKQDEMINNSIEMLGNLLQKTK